MFDLSSFSVANLLRCSAALRQIGDDADSMEGAASAIAAYLQASLGDPDSGESALALVRVYKTHRYDELEPEVARHAAQCVDPDVSLTGVPCLTLLGTAGVEPQWNDRHASRGHQAIPLSSTASVEATPMVAGLFSELGLDIAEAVGPGSTLFRSSTERQCGVFHVTKALGSPQVPAQDFVQDYGIESVLGFGGILPDGHMFAVVMFSTMPVPSTTAEEFSTLAFSVNLALLPFVERRIFVTEPAAPPSHDPDWLARINAARVMALNGLFDAGQQVVVEQSEALEASEAFKTAILDAAMECIITIDEAGRVLDFNPAAERTFGRSRRDVLGLSLAELIIPARMRQAHVEGLRGYLKSGISRIVNQRVELEAMRADGTEFPVELTVTRAAAADPPAFVGYVRDITERRAYESALAIASQRSAHIAETLQTSLLPPALPDVPGLDLAGFYRAAGEGYDVGGDFYDVFEIGKDDWAFVLGDVMGKGPEAAVITALARYTIRAAAIRARKPAAVLDLLNAAINLQHPERSCTAIYGRVRRRASGVKLTLGSGGHVPALLRRSTGEVVQTEAAGTLLGPFADWSGSSQTLDLRTDDLLLAFSDGVTEARHGAELFGERRLIDLLAATAGMSAESTVREVETAVEAFCPKPVDDVAILALRVATAADQ